MTSELQRDVDLYVEISEKWKHDHAQAMACYGFEDVLAKGASLFSLIVGAEERWRIQVYRDETPYSDRKAAEFLDLIKAWLKPCDTLLGEPRHFEDAGFSVKHSREFRRCVGEAKGIVTPDSEFFSHQRLVEERDRAIDETRESA
jgi:hypothetical protein